MVAASRLVALWGALLLTLMPGIAQASAPPAESTRLLAAVPTGSGRYPIVAGGRGDHVAVAWLAKSGRGLALRTALVRDGRLVSARIVRRSATRTGLSVLGIGVDRRGRQHLLFAANPRGKAMRLMTSERRGAGRWSRPHQLGEVATGGLLSTRTEGVLVTSPAGDTTALWCIGGQSDNVLDHSDPGSLMTATLRRGARRWPAPRRLWRGQFCSFPELQGNARGDLLASWYAEPAEVDDASRVIALRARGRWSRATPVASLPWPRGPFRLGLGGDGSALTTGGPVPGDLGIAVSLGVLDRRGTQRELAIFDGPAPAGATDGWAGAGEAADVTAPVGRSAASTALVVRDPRGRADGASDLPAVWSIAHRGAQAAQSIVDDLAVATAIGQDERDEPLSADLSAGPDGQPVATWVAAGGAPCTIAFYRSMQRTDGTWTRRVLSAAEPTKRADCGGEPVRTAAGGALILTEGNAGRTNLWSAAASVGGAPAPTLALRTATWSAIRSAGAIEFSCRAPGALLCTVSLARALESPPVAEALTASCRPSAAGARVGADGTAIVRFPLRTACVDGGPAPALPAERMDLPVLAVADAVGRTSTPTTALLAVSP